LQIDVQPSRPVILETGSLGPAVKMFDKCSRDSLRDWGVDPDLEDKIVRPVWALKPQQWFSANDYPQSMWAQNKESEVRVRLLVDAAGNVSKCTSLSHYDEPAFNKTVCDIFMKRAKFEPAELADGTKVPSYYIKHIVFRMGY
jgi:TonB family protein